MTDEQVGRIREGLSRKGWSQTDLAKAIDVRDSTISANLHPDQELRTGPRTSTFRAICEAIEINPGYLMLGLEPKWVDAKKPASATDLRPVPTSLGIDRWLSDTVDGRSTSDDERATLRNVPWPDPYTRYPDDVYKLVLSGLRQAMNATR